MTEMVLIIAESARMSAQKHCRDTASVQCNFVSMPLKLFNKYLFEFSRCFFASDIVGNKTS